MTKTEVVDSSQEKPEKKNTDTMSQSEDAYAPEEPTPDIPIPLLDIQMPETPESTKGQTSDGDLPRLESPKMLKPVLGKVQAKKRLMAFANKFNVLPKVQNKPNVLQAHSAKSSKSKNKSEDESSTGLNTDSDSTQQFLNRHTSSGKAKKKPEEKILAIEEIRREESKSKMLLAEAMAAASLEEDYRNGQNLLENIKSIRERNKQDDSTASRKSGSRSSIESKYSERRRHSKEERRSSVTRESKDCSGSKDRYYKTTQDREQRRKDKDRKDDKDKRDDTIKYEENRDRREDDRDKKDSEKDRWEEVKEKRAVKEKKEGFREKRSNSRERSSEVKDKREKEKDKDKGKEKNIIHPFSWEELKSCGIIMDDIIDTRRRDYSERSTKNRTAEDYLLHFEQMLLLNDYRLKRNMFVAEGLDGPKEYPPESVKVTKRGRPQLLYCENPRMSLFLNHQQVLQTVATDRREKMREICEANVTRDNTEEADTLQHVRNWYPKAGVCATIGKNKWHLPMSIQLPRSKWDSEDEERLSNNSKKEQKSEVKPDDTKLPPEQEAFSSCTSVTEKNVNSDKNISNETNESSSIKQIDDDNGQSASPVLPSAGNEKLASEYEQFMKMVCTDIPTPKEYSPKAIPAKAASPSSYHEFNIETNLPEDNNFPFVERSLSGKSDKSDMSKSEEKYKANDGRQDLEKISKIADDQVSASSSRIRVQEQAKESKDSRERSVSNDSRSIPSDWENVRIKVERLSDENSDSREARRKKKHKKVSSSSDSSSTSSSSDSEDGTKKRRRKRKLSHDESSYSDSDSSESSSSSSDSSSSDDKRKKKRKKKRKAERRKKKAKKRLARTKKKRRRKVSSDSSSSDSSEDTPKKRLIANKKSKQKSDYNEKEDDAEDIIKVLQKSASECSSPGNEKLMHSQIPMKKIKGEAKMEDRRKSTEKYDIWSKEQGLLRKAHKNEERRSKVEERYLKEWEIGSSIEKMDSAEVERFRKTEKKDERSKKEEHFKEKRLSISEDIEGSAKIEEDSDVKKKKKRDKEKKTSNEFLADWEKETERISQQIMQDEIRFSKKLDKQRKEKWGETEFDTLNVPSLTQLEREVSKRHLLADEWEVDSLEAVPELMLGKRKSSRNSKKLEKEVRYDKKTDTYIAIEKDTPRECRKRQDRLSAMRIWEEEQEEGEREAMLLLEQKSKRKRDEWDIEEESFLREKEGNQDKIEDTMQTIGIHAEINVCKDLDTSLKHDVSKKSKRSRWDIASQVEEKMEELKAPVMWEEECAEWTKINKFEHKIDKVTLERCEPILSKSKIKDEDSGILNQPLRTSTSDIDLFPRKCQNLDLDPGSWTPEELARSVSRIKSLESISQRDIFLEKAKEQIPTSSTKEQQNSEQIEDIFDIDAKIPQKNIELYSPSSPAASQKSEDIEAFNDRNLNSLNFREDLSQDKLKTEISTKPDEESIALSNIPLQIKYRDGKYAKLSMPEEQFEDILSVPAEDQSLHKKFDRKSEISLSDLSINEPCLDANYKSLRMDIFAEYESDESRSISSNKNSEVTSSTSTKGEESNEGKAALKLIPKQLLIRRNNERVKTKLISDDPLQHAAALLTIQKKLRESHTARNDEKNISAEGSNEFELERKEITSTDTTSVVDVALTDPTIVTGIKVDSKDLSIAVKSAVATHSESPGSAKVDFERIDEYKSSDRGTIPDELKIAKEKDINDTETHSRSPNRDQRRKSPGRKEHDRRINDRSKERRGQKFEDREKSDKRDDRSSRTDYTESRRKSSPSSSRKRRRSASPHSSWEQERSRSESHSRSWSRSRSKSPKRKDEASSREKRSSRMDEDRSRSRTDDRRERSMRSPRSNTAVYNKDYFKKYGPAKGDREDWNRRKYDCTDRERDKEGRSYDSTEVLRERNMDPDRHRESRFRGDEADHAFWQYEAENVLRDANESLESYANGQELDLEYDEKAYYRDDSIERDIMEGPLRSIPKYKSRRNRSNMRRDRQWEKSREQLDLDRHGHVRRSEKLSSRDRSSPRQKRSSPRVTHDRFRRGSRSRSKSWSRSRSRSRSRTRSRSRSTSRSRQTLKSRSKSPSGSRSRTRSTSGSRLRSPDHSSRATERMRSSRSPSAGRSRGGDSFRERRDEHSNRKLENCGERGRRIETIVQSGLSRVTADSGLDSEMHGGDALEPVAPGFQYPNESEIRNEYYYSENNLTYPPCIDDTAANSPKRLSLDDRLELELGIKKQQDSTGVSSEYPENYNATACYPSPTQQQQQMLYRQQPTVLQVGNVLQVVPADFNGVPSALREPANTTPTPVSNVRGSSQVVRVGNVLQVVPTSLDWSGGQPSTVDQSSGLMYSATVPQPSPVSAVPAVPISVPVPVPVPMPVPAVPAVISSTTPVSTLSPVPLPISVPVPVPGPGPIPLPVPQTPFPRPEVTSQKVPAQPVYNYEAILESRRKEREERKRLREIKRKEKERRRIERINRRALRLLEKNNKRQSDNSNQSTNSALDPSVLKALRESEEQAEVEEQQQTPVATEKEEDPIPGPSTSTEEEEAVPDEDEEEEEEEEPEVEEDEEEEEEEDEEEEEEDDEKASSRINNRLNEVEEAPTATTSESNKTEIESEPNVWTDLPPIPLKGILVATGFRTLPNGNLDDLSTPENDSDDNVYAEGVEVDKNESNLNDPSENKPGKSKYHDRTKWKSVKLSKKKVRTKKSVQFADGIKPGEGTSPSGGEGDMPSPPPPTSTVITRDGIREIRRSSSRKNRKQGKRTRPPKAKKKVKVKIIKLKKPRVTPLTAMMMDDSDELDDRSPPPPPPGSPPPPHLWPNYLSAYNATTRTSEVQPTTPTASSTVQAPPPPTPLPLLVPPPPLNYTIQPCSKA